MQAVTPTNERVDMLTEGGPFLSVAYTWPSAGTHTQVSACTLSASLPTVFAHYFYFCQSVVCVANKLMRHLLLDHSSLVVDECLRVVRTRSYKKQATVIFSRCARTVPSLCIARYLVGNWCAACWRTLYTRVWEWVNGTWIQVRWDLTVREYKFGGTYRAEETIERRYYHSSIP